MWRGGGGSLMGWQNREGSRQLETMFSCGRLQAALCAASFPLVLAYVCFVSVIWEKFCDDFFLLCFVALVNQEIML
jgi:hypothetical protein